MFARVRKAVLAGAGAALTAFVTTWINSGAPEGAEGWVAVLAASLGAGVVAGVAVWRVPNAPAAA